MTTEAPKKQLPRGMIVTEEARLSYPALFVPKTEKKDDGSEVSNYSCSLIFPNQTPKTLLIKAITEVLIDKFGADPNDPNKWNAKAAGRFRMPIRDGKDYAEDPSNPRPEYEDSYFVGAKSKQKPTVLLQDRRTPADDSQSETGVYAGCWVRAAIKAYWYENPKNRGVTFSLEHVLKVRDDDPLGRSATRAEDVFGPPPDAPASSDDSSFMG